METINDIVREMRKLGELDEKSTCRIPRSLMGLGLRTYADRIEASIKAYNKEITELLKEVIGGVCLHCDLQTACQEGEDGMSTTCNAVAKATHFIKQHTEPESDKDLPF